MPLMAAVLRGDQARIKSLLAARPGLAFVECDKSPDGPRFVRPMTPAEVAASRYAPPEAFRALLAAVRPPERPFAYEESLCVLSGVGPEPADARLADEAQAEKMAALLDRFPRLVGYYDEPRGHPDLLGLAASKDQFATVRVLIARGASLKVDVFNGTPLHSASSPEMARLLVKAGADPNARNHNNGDTPLMTAVMAGRDPVVAALVGLGARLDAVDNEGDTPLIVAELGPTLKEVSVLVRLGASPDAPSPATGLTPLDCAVQRRGNAPGDEGDGSQGAEAVSALVACGASVDGRDRWGDTPALSWVRHYVRVFVRPTHDGWVYRSANWDRVLGPLRRIASLGADLSAKDMDGLTCRDLLARGGFVEELATLPAKAFGPG